MRSILLRAGIFQHIARAFRFDMSQDAGEINIVSEKNVNEVCVCLYYPMYTFNQCPTGGDQSASIYYSLSYDTARRPGFRNERCLNL